MDNTLNPIAGFLQRKLKIYFISFDDIPQPLLDRIKIYNQKIPVPEDKLTP